MNQITVDLRNNLFPKLVETKQMAKPSTFVLIILRLEDYVGAALGPVPVDPEVVRAAAEDESTPLAQLVGGLTAQEALPDKNRHDVFGNRRRLGP